MRLAVVTTLPTRDRAIGLLSGLEHHAVHLIPALLDHPHVQEVHVIAQQAGGKEIFEHPKLTIHRSWKKGALSNCLRIWCTVRSLNPDVVYFNIHMGYLFGNNHVSNGLGLLSPVLCRLRANNVVCTFHDFVEVVNLREYAYQIRPHHIVAAKIVQRLMVWSSRYVTVMSEWSLRQLERSYGTSRAVLIPHGIWDPSPLPLNNVDNKTLLMFGTIARNKDWDLLFQVFSRLKSDIDGLRLIIAGGRHPSDPGFYEQIEERASSIPGVEFRGFVPDDSLRALFAEASVVVLPYKHTTGTSGAIRRAIGYARPIVASRVPEFEAMQRSHVGMLIYEPADPQLLLFALRRVIESPTLRAELAQKNAQACARESYEDSVNKYVELFERAAHRD